MPLLETIARSSPAKLFGKGTSGAAGSWHLPLSSRRAVLEKALGLLPARKRLVVALRHYEGLTLTEMAHAMGTDKDSVRGLLDDAVARLSRALLKADDEARRRSAESTNKTT